MLPHFLVIGAPKSGTGWLYHNLRFHPEVWLPPVKEIRYFNNPSPLPLITFLLARRTYPEALRVRRLLKNRLRKVFARGNKDEIRWHLLFLLSPRGDRWYANLFSPSAAQIVGDISPVYSSLSADGVSKVRHLLPDTKIIYLLRNPIYRTWSNVAMYFRNHGDGLARASEQQIYDRLEHIKEKKFSDYYHVLQLWEKFYPSQQILIGFFDQLSETPVEFLKDIYRFLDISDSEAHIPETITRKHNAYKYPDIPDHFLKYLARQHHTSIRKLHQSYGSVYSADWLAFVERYC